MTCQRHFVTILLGRLGNQKNIFFREDNSCVESELFYSKHGLNEEKNSLKNFMAQTKYGNKTDRKVLVLFASDRIKAKAALEDEGDIPPDNK